MSARAAVLTATRSPLLRAPGPNKLQPLLRIGASTDPFEAQADAVADAVLRMPAAGSSSERLQRCAGGCPGDEELRRQAVDERDDEEELRRLPVDGGESALLDAATAGRLDATRGGGAGLPVATRGFVEPRFAADFPAVRVHGDDQAAGLAAAAVNAPAFTVGRDVFFGAGKYRPGATAGDRLLAHELTHALQQGTTGAVRRRVAADRVTCANAQPGSPILNRIGTDDPAGVLSAVDTRAMDMLDAVIDTLTHGRDAILGGAQPGWPTIGDVTAVVPRDRLGLDPSDPAVWTGDQARSVRTVIRRLQGPRRHLTSGWLRWSAGTDEQALTLLHEALHIFFGFPGGGTGQFGNAGCYEQLVADLHGLGERGVR